MVDALRLSTLHFSPKKICPVGRALPDMVGGAHIKMFLVYAALGASQRKAHSTHHYDFLMR